MPINQHLYPQLFKLNAIKTFFTIQYKVINAINLVVTSINSFLRGKCS